MQTTTVPKPLTAAAIFRPAKPGRIVQVRPVLKQDREGLGALYARASSRSRYLRFFTAGISIDREVQRLIAPADDHGRRGPVFTHSSRYRRKAEWGGRRGLHVHGGCGPP